MQHTIGAFAVGGMGCYECHRPANTPEQREALANSECGGYLWLSHAMEFDHPIRIMPDGSISDAPANLYAPNLYDEELDSEDWEMLTGYSGQYGYAGPVMHNSEFIGGGMARDILSEPGVYVAVVAAYSPEEPDSKNVWEGWAVCRYTGEDTE